VSFIRNESEWFIIKYCKLIISRKIMIPEIKPTIEINTKITLKKVLSSSSSEHAIRPIFSR